MKLPLAILAMIASFGAHAQQGRILVAVGICTDSVAELPVVVFRKVDKSANFRAAGAFFGMWDYTDDTGKFKVHAQMLEAGEWEMYRHEITTKKIAQTVRHSPRSEYSLRFTVAPGKLVDLGRYCAGTQATGEVFPDSDRVWNTVANLVYMHVSPNREADVEAARKADGGALLELVPARPDPPQRVSPTLTNRFVEPRLIRKPAAPKPMEIPR